MFSRNHTTLNPKKDKQYWKQTNVQRMGEYDLPAFIEKVKTESN